MCKVKFPSKRAFAQALLDGRKFKYGKALIRFDEKATSDSPFRLGDSELHGVWDYCNSPGLIEVLPWYENIPEKGVVCWVSNGQPDSSKRHVVDVVTRYVSPDYKFEGNRGRWLYATPLIAEDLLQAD